ncbi:MAG: cytochrome c oxidase subunit 3 family protein [Sulfuricella sp.]|nr:cytochrome c oxidase subunit 3 family protein [Sulfuricella sp.]
MASVLSTVAPQFDDAEQQRAAATLGMWIFLATEILFFGVLFAAYTLTRVRHPEAFAAGSRLTHVTLASLNTGVLLTSSLTMALAGHAARTGARRALVAWLGLTVALGAGFLAIKGIEYRLDFTEHLVPALNFAYAGPRADQVELFFFVYFLVTGVHALHVFIGVAAIAAIAVMASRRAFTPAYFTPVEVTGLYWHLVDIVWLFVYPLLYLVSRA